MKSEWRFIEQTFVNPPEARMRYYVFRCSMDFHRAIRNPNTVSRYDLTIILFGGTLVYGDVYTSVEDRVFP